MRPNFAGKFETYSSKTFSCLLLYPNGSATVTVYDPRQYVEKVMNFCLCNKLFSCSGGSVERLGLYILVLFTCICTKCFLKLLFFPNFMGTLCNKTPLLTAAEVVCVIDGGVF